MIFIDSWVWLEFLFDGACADKAEAVIERANSSDEGGLIAPTVIAEVAYRARVDLGEAAAEQAINAIQDFEHIESLPLVDEVAEHAAALRYDLYERGSRELSYADAIHLTTARLHDDCTLLYSGDPDFADIDVVKTAIIG